MRPESLATSYLALATSAKAGAILETELTAAGVPHDLKVYTGAKHAFFNDQWRNHHPAAAADSWQRVLAFRRTRQKKLRKDPRLTHSPVIKLALPV
jgi:dienelactone hydrolase